MRKARLEAPNTEMKFRLLKRPPPNLRRNPAKIVTGKRGEDDVASFGCGMLTFAQRVVGLELCAGETRNQQSSLPAWERGLSL